jgi:cell wall-associated NlpC family hydrolase
VEELGNSVAMRRAALFLVLGVVIAALGVATARAAAPGGALEATTTGTTTDSTTAATTTATTATTTAPTTTSTAPATTAATTTTPAVTSPQPIAKPTHLSSKRQSKKQRRRQPMRPPPDYPASPYPFLSGGGLAPVAQHNAIVSIAMRFLGIPYKWGGARPKTGFDCSGLVQYVFAQLGYSLPHYAAAQWYSPNAVWVAPNRLRPGDLVFFIGADGTRRAPGHVGIYVGDGYLIDAPHTKSFVRIDNLNDPWFANNYVGAKRIVGASLDARRLLTTASAAVPAARLFLSRQAAGRTAGLPATVVEPTVAHASAATHYELWTGVGLASVLLIVVGAVPYRHRRRQQAPESRSP